MAAYSLPGKDTAGPELSSGVVVPSQVLLPLLQCPQQTPTDLNVQGQCLLADDVIEKSSILFH